MAKLRRALPALVIGAYIAVACVWIYGVFDRVPRPSANVWIAAVIALAAVHLLAGVVLRVQAFLLLVLLVLLAIPAGAIDADGDKAPVALAAVIWVFPALGLVAVGLLLGGLARSLRTG